MELTAFDYSGFYLVKKKEVAKFIDSVLSNNEVNGKIILDAGCRTGEYSSYFSEKGAKSVTGVDISGKSIELARKRFKQKNLNFLQGDITNLSKFKSNTFDIIFCIGTMPYLNKERVQKALKEFLRVAKPDGKIIVTFQKEKGIIGKIARFKANILPLNLWIFASNVFSRVLTPLASLLLKRKISKEYLKYGVLLSLRGIHFGVPVNIDNKFIIKTPECINYSEKTTTTFKIVNKK